MPTERDPRPPTVRSPAPRDGGFTLIELIIVVAIIGILATVALPAMQNAPQKAREAVVRADLYQIRSTIDQYLADKGYYPESLEVLVDAGYLRFMPADPWTGSTDVWEGIPASASDVEELEPLDTDLAPTGGGIMDVRYKPDRVALDGSLMSEW